MFISSRDFSENKYSSFDNSLKIRGVWYMYLKTCVELRVSKKMCENTYNIFLKLKRCV